MDARDWDYKDGPLPPWTARSCALDARDQVHKDGPQPFWATRECYLITKKKIAPILTKDRTYGGALYSMDWAEALLLWRGKRTWAGIFLTPRRVPPSWGRACEALRGSGFA